MKVVKLKLPSLARRLSKLGRRSSTDKNKSPAVDSTTSPVSAGSRQLTADDSVISTSSDDPHPPTPVPGSPIEQLKSKDHDALKDKYEQGTTIIIIIDMKNTVASI